MSKMLSTRGCTTSGVFAAVTCMAVIASVLALMSRSTAVSTTQMRFAIATETNPSTPSVAVSTPETPTDDACAAVGADQLTYNTMEPLMTATDRSLLYKYLDKSEYYFETGSGGSTYQAAIRPNIKRMVVVESNPVWIDILRKSSVIHHEECQRHKLKLFFVDINSSVTPSGFSYPQGRSKKHNWPVYAGAISLLAGSPWHAKPDTIFIDGRFRVACAVHAYRVASSEAIIMIHDYMMRPAYHVVEKFLEVVEQGDQLVVFKKKQLVGEEDAAVDDLLQDHMDMAQ